MSARATGLAIAALAVVVGVAPVLPWFRVDVSGPARTSRGIDVAGELWALPPIALCALAAGIALATLAPARGPATGRWCAGIAAVAGALATAWSLNAVLDVDAAAAPVDVPAGPAAPLVAQSAAFAAPAAASLMAALALWWLRSFRATGRPSSST